MDGLFQVIGIIAMALALSFLIYGLVCIVKKKGKKRILFVFGIFAILGVSVFVCNYYYNAYQQYNSALRVIKEDKHLDSAKYYFAKAGGVRDSAKSHDLIDAFYNEEPGVFYDKAESYFSDDNASISNDDLCRHMYHIFAEQSPFPVQTAWEYYRMFLLKYIEELPGSNSIISQPENAYDCIADTDGAWLSACGKDPKGKAIVYLRYEGEALEKLADPEKRRGISLRFVHLLDEKMLPQDPGDVEYIILVELYMEYAGHYTNWAPAYRLCAAVNVYDAKDMQLLRQMGTAYSDVPEGFVTTDPNDTSDVICTRMNSARLGELIGKAAAFIAEQ